MSSPSEGTREVILEGEPEKAGCFKGSTGVFGVGGTRSISGDAGRGEGAGEASADGGRGGRSRMEMSGSSIPWRCDEIRLEFRGEGFGDREGLDNVPLENSDL